MTHQTPRKAQSRLNHAFAQVTVIFRSRLASTASPPAPLAPHFPPPEAEGRRLRRPPRSGGPGARAGTTVPLGDAHARERRNRGRLLPLRPERPPPPRLPAGRA